MFQSWIKLKGFDESPQMKVFTLHAESYVCYAQSIQQLPPAEGRMVVFTLQSLPDLYAHTVWIIILALNKSNSQ